MASSSKVGQELPFYKSLAHYPPVIDGRINVVQFLKASADLIKLVDRLGTLFAPVKYDMQGNIDKIKTFYDFDDNSCLLDLMVTETPKGNRGYDSVLWLNRALLFCELMFQEIIVSLKSNNHETSLKKIITMAYEGSVKKYHNWITQQIFAFICKMAPTFPQLLKLLEAEDIKDFEYTITNFNIKLNLVRQKIDDCFSENNICESNYNNSF